MNLLVTNTDAPQAYDIIYALRAHSSKIVATMEGDSPLVARLAHAANSRLVDKRYFTPSPIRDWQAGRIGPENTDREEAFIQALERICADEKIDFIFPSWDPHVYVLSKNRERLARAGAVVPVPDYATVLTAIDKYRTIRAAEEVGYPCPRTYLYEPGLDLKVIADREGFPLVIKPRFTSGGRGLAIVKDYAELAERLPAIAAVHGAPLIQEYIPGRHRDSVQFVVDREGELKFVFHKRRRRQFRVTARLAAVSESARPDAFLSDARRLVARIGWWGAMGIEAIHDPRDGIYKLLEVNPRFPRQLWNRTGLGINEPLMCMRIARGEPVERIVDYPVGVVFVNPVEDVQLLALQIADTLAYKVRAAAGRRSPIDASKPPSFRQQIGSFTRTYTGGERKVFDPYFTHFLRDPVASALWWLKLARWVAGGVKQIGK